MLLPYQILGELASPRAKACVCDYVLWEQRGAGSNPLVCSVLVRA